MNAKWKLPLLTGLLGVLVGMTIQYMLMRPELVVESYKPEVVLSNGAVALERKADLPPPAPIKKAAKELGGKLVRAGTVVIAPEPTPDSPPECKCKEIELNFGVTDEGDGQRVIFETDDGKIVGGFDSPQVPYEKPPSMNWEVGVLVPLDNPKGIGPSISKRMGAFKMGISAAKPKQGGWTGFATATYSW